MAGHRAAAVSAEQAAPLPGLPAPGPVADALRGTAFAAELERLAGRVMEHRFPLLGVEIDAGPEIHWRRDYLHSRESDPAYFRLLPYLDFSRVGDHKVIWELNRHQHLVLLAQAFVITGREEFLEEIERQWRSWIEANPFQRGINWASALEVAFRALSWIWIYHLVGGKMEAGWRSRFLTELYRHGLHLEHNLSVYFSPNTHLLGEAVALHALGVLFPSFPRARRWERMGGDVVRQQLERQILADGAHFERSSYYHVYALDFFLFHYIVADRPAAFRPVLERMAEYLGALLGPARDLPLIGDDDGGRLFHPYGEHTQFGRATLATCGVLFDRWEWLGDAGDLYPQAAWWLGVTKALLAPKEPAVSRLFPEAGTAIMTAGELWIASDAGGFGPFRAGHSHSDALSVIARLGGRELLIDSGTYTYIADPEWRNWFRGSAAHNTIRVDGQNQATPLGPFAWDGRPRVEVREWRTSPECDFLDASCRPSSGDWTHRRRIFFVKPDVLWILDEVEGQGEHFIEQFWHCGQEVAAVSPRCFRIGGDAILALGGDAAAQSGGEHGWRSRALGQKEPSPVIVAARKAALPAVFATALVVAAEPLALDLQKDGAGVRMRLSDGRAVYFAAIGLPNSETRPSE